MQTDDAGTDAIAPGSGVCVLCSDGLYHCDGPAYAPCPSGIQNGDSCAGWDAGPGAVSSANCWQPCPNNNSIPGVPWICEPKMTWSGNGCP